MDRRRLRGGEEAGSLLGGGDDFHLPPPPADRWTVGLESFSVLMQMGSDSGSGSGDQCDLPRFLRDVARLNAATPLPPDRTVLAFCWLRDGGGSGRKTRKWTGYARLPEEEKTVSAALLAEADRAERYVRWRGGLAPAALCARVLVLAERTPRRGGGGISLPPPPYPRCRGERVPMSGELAPLPGKLVPLLPLKHVLTRFYDLLDRTPAHLHPRGIGCERHLDF